MVDPFREGVTYTIRFRNIDGIDAVTLRDILDDILRRRLVNLAPGDRVGVELDNINLDRRVLVPFANVADMTVDMILSVVERVQQSNKSFGFDNHMTMKLVVVRNPRGAGPTFDRSTTRIVNWAEWKRRHTGHCGCFVQVPSQN